MPDVGTVTVVRDTTGGSVAQAMPHRMELRSESGKLVVGVDLAPREIDYDGFAHDWASADRSGSKPLLLHKGTPLRTMAFTLPVTDKYDLHAPQTAKIAQYAEVARSFERIMVRYSGMEQGLWRITAMSMTSELRDPEGNEITRGAVTVTLTEASDPAPAVGPISRPPPPPPAPPPVGRIHIVVKGNTLWGIAKQYYGNGALWPRLYDANRHLIRDPHWIFPGQRFVIP